MPFCSAIIAFDLLKRWLWFTRWQHRSAISHFGKLLWRWSLLFSFRASFRRSVM